MKTILFEFVLKIVKFIRVSNEERIEIGSIKFMVEVVVFLGCWWF